MAELGERMSAAEFGMWLVVLAEEPIDGAELDLHFQLVAAAANGSRFVREDGKAWTPADFGRLARWQPQVPEAPAVPEQRPPTGDELKQQVAALWRGGK